MFDAFDTWFEQLKQEAVMLGFTEHAIKTFHPNDWRDYFVGGYSPSEALAEDSSYT